VGIGNGIYRLNCTPEEIISIKILEEKKKIEKGKKCKYHKALVLACSCGVNISIKIFQLKLATTIILSDVHHIIYEKWS
jgi:hypothetical protein